MIMDEQHYMIQKIYKFPPIYYYELLNFLIDIFHSRNCYVLTNQFSFQLEIIIIIQKKYCSQKFSLHN